MHPEIVTASFQLDGRLLVLYDGYCGLCNRAVRWFLRRDRHDRFRFAPASSPAVSALLAESEASLAARTILVLCDSGQPEQQLFVRSEAILLMLAELPRPWPAVVRVLRLIPCPLRDLAYGFIARIRYRLWGRYDACPLPSAAERAHFLD